MLRGLEFRDVLMKTSSFGQENKQRLKKEIFDQHFNSEDPNQETIDKRLKLPGCCLEEEISLTFTHG